ncbi:MAG: M3 family peptidase, partial [Alistipes sp.]|nr:M3 family peptidase [Alistipes sp.]
MKKLLTFMSATLLMMGCGDNTIPQVQLPELDTTNPLLAEWNTPHQTPPFDLIRAEHYEPAFEAAIAISRLEVDAIVNNPAKPTFANTVVALEKQGALLSRVAGLFFNIREADSSKELNEIAMRVQPKLTELSNDIALNAELFKRIKEVYQNPGWFLSKEDKKLLEETYNDFVRGGANLSDEDKALYREYSSELSSLTLKFGENSLNATNAFSYNIRNPKLVAELPEFVRESMALDAKARGEKGWTLTLKAPSYVPFMTYSSQRDIKEKVWRASNTRALGGEFDNSENIRRITELRLKIARLLGYECHADYVLANRMAENTETVNGFLAELLEATKEAADADYKTINDYAASLGFEGELMPWDFGYYSERYKKEKYAVSDEQIKPYLQLESVKEAVFMLANRLYGIT